MTRHSIIVRAVWDAEASVWIATSQDVDGLCVEADTLENLQHKVQGALVDLIELNGLDFEEHDIPVHILSEQLTRIENPRH